MAIIEEMKQIQLTRREQLLLAEYALKARFGSLEPVQEPPAAIEGEYREVVEAEPSTALVTYSPESLLRRRRREDLADDLDTVVNVIQENSLKKSGAVGLDTKGRRHRSRAVKGIDTTIKVNTLLWQFAQELRKFKLES